MNRENTRHSRFVTVAMLCAHAGKHRATILRALRAAGISAERAKGLRGLRLTERDARRFLSRQWPEIPPLS